MTLNFASKLKACAAPFNFTSCNGTMFNRGTYLLLKLHSSLRCCSSKDTFPFGKIRAKSQIKDPEKQRGNWTVREAPWKEIGLNRKGTSQQRSPSKFLFAAGNAKRRAEENAMGYRIKAPLVSAKEPSLRPKKIDKEMIKIPEQPLSIADWRKLKSESGNIQDFENIVMLKLFTTEAKLDIAKSLLTFAVAESGTLSYLLMTRYLSCCVGGGHDDEVYDTYVIMRDAFPTLETGACSLFIKSFCRSQRWREALVLLQELKKIVNPTLGNYTYLISAAVQDNALTEAWVLHEELLERGVNPSWEILEALFKGPQGAEKQEEGVEKQEEGAKLMPRAEHDQRLTGVLHHMREDVIYPQKSVAAAIKTWFESLDDQKWEGRWTSVSSRGICRSCGKELESVELTAQEYQHLKDEVMANVIRGSDIFTKTTPKELQRFEAFLRTNPAFDVVVDGLNTAHTSAAHNKVLLSEKLLAVVSELARQNLKVLVLGRKHMLVPSRNWNRNDMDRILNTAHCFFADNISEDDPFLLYAALNSGSHCKFVSLDLMRSHKKLLQGTAKKLFFKWQRGHQLVVVAPRNDDVRFLGIPKYDTIVQTTGSSWHIPYDSTDDRSSFEVPEDWLCLTRPH